MVRNVKPANIVVLLMSCCFVGSVWAEAADLPVRKKPGYEWRRTDSSLALLNHGKVVWQLNFDKKEGKPYFHPVSLADGTELTWLRPADHPWHRALWFSWKFINGVNYWEEDPKTGLSPGRTDIQSGVRIVRHDDYSAYIEMTLRYHPPGERAELMEKRIIRISSPNVDGQYYIDWTSVFSAVSKDVLLSRTPIPGEEGGKAWGGYAGLSVRMAKATRGFQFVDSDGRKDKQVHGKKARWVDFSGELPDGKEAGITIFDYPENLRHPSPWYVERSMPYFSPAMLFNRPYRLAAGNIMKLRYRILIHPGRLDTKTLEKEWKILSGLEDQTERFNKPIFGIYLGEPLSDLKERFSVKPWSVDSANWRNLSRSYQVNHSDKSIDYCSVEVFENKIFRLSVHFVGDTKEHFRVLEKQFEKEFGKPKVPRKGRFIGSSDGVEVEVLLTKGDGITVYAVHLPLLEKRSEKALKWELERRRAIRVDLLVCEINECNEIDRETTEEIKNLLGQDKALSTAAVLKSAVQRKQVARNKLASLVDLLSSKGYLKILMNPTLEVVDGKTAKVRSSQRVPTGKEITDSFEVTPKILDDGYMNVSAKMVFQNEQISDLRKRVRDGQSFISGSIINKPDRIDEPATETIFIITAAINKDD